MPRKRHVSRNITCGVNFATFTVMPRKRHVSRNNPMISGISFSAVMPRKRHVSRNSIEWVLVASTLCHASQEACE